jgi:RNAse (barnase) inhibitor barstar
VLLGIIGTVDLHHGRYSSDPPYHEVEVIGAAPSPEVEREFATRGLTELTTTADGYVVARLVRAEVVEIDVGHINSVAELHDKLAAALGFPGFYGRNWDAFWDAISGLVPMPKRLVIHGWSNVATRWPRDAQVMAGFLRDLNVQHPSYGCDFELRP